MAEYSDCPRVLAPVIQENQLVLPESTDGLTLGDYVPVLMQYREINKTIVFDYRDKKVKVCGLSEDQAKGVIMAIRDGAIPAVSIDYRWKPKE